MCIIRKEEKKGILISGRAGLKVQVEQQERQTLSLIKGRQIHHD